MAQLALARPGGCCHQCSRGPTPHGRPGSRRQRLTLDLESSEVRRRWHCPCVGRILIFRFGWCARPCSTMLSTIKLCVVPCNSYGHQICGRSILGMRQSILAPLESTVLGTFCRIGWNRKFLTIARVEAPGKIRSDTPRQAMSCLHSVDMRAYSATPVS